MRGHTCNGRERRGAGPTSHGADGKEWRKGTEREGLPKVKMSREQTVKMGRSRGSAAAI